jgi:RHS repeat-associated protein
MMNTTKLLRQIMILAVFALVAVAAAGAEAGGERYIVILKSRSGPAPDVARLGGTINFRQQDQVNVTLPREALAALRTDPLVRYVQAVAGAGDVPLIGEPDEPTPGAPRRLVPHATAGNQSWSRSYSYDDSGNITNIGSQQFVYDALGRLKEMATSGSITEQYGYDRYGNQTSRTSGGVLQQIPTETTTNQLSTGYTYDPAGNLKTGDGYTLTYDALGQAATKIYTAANTFNETYIYTAGEERLGVLTSNTAETSSWWYWSVRDEGGKVLRQYRSTANDPTQTALWVEDYVYRDGLLVGAERPPTMGGRRHFHLDHLGSPRLITSNDGQIVSMHDYLPFGGETTSVFQEENGGFDREDPMKFTGHERDYAGSFGREDGHVIDYMHARYYTPTTARFLSVDPLDGNIGIPQSWNRYAYVSNNPINYVDPTGMATTGWVCNDDGCSTTVTPDPPPQLPPGAIVRQSFFWDHPLGSLAEMRNPLTGMTIREHARVTGHGLAAFADGVIPDVPFCDVCDEYTDPFAGAGTYNISEPGMRTNQIIGAATRDIEIALASSGSSTLFGRGSWANSNPLGAGRFRLGQSTLRNTTYFSARGKWIDAMKAIQKAHIDLWILRR